MEELIDELIKSVIPIYTIKNPDSEGKIDCPIKKMHKDGKRYMMRQKINDLIQYYDERPKDTEQGKVQDAL